MRIFVTLLIALMALSSTAFAEFRGTILSYDQFSHLTPEKREAYLVQYRRLMIMMENEQMKHGIYEVQRGDSFEEQVAMMMNYFAFAPQADAEDSGTVGKGPPKVLPQPSSTEPDGWDCSSFNTWSAVYKFDPKIGTCIQMNSGWLGPMTASTSFKSGATCPGPSDSNEGTVAIPSPDGNGRIACIPLSSYNKLDDGRRVLLQNGHYLPPGGASPEAVLGKLQPAQPAKETPGAKDTAKTEGDTFKDRFPKVSGDPEKGSTIEMPEKAPANSKADEKKPDALGDTCAEPANKTCGDKANDLESVQNFRKDAADDNNSCIVGGFFSKYDNPSPRKNEGKCHYNRQFPPEPKTAITTCGKGQAMCNPFLFCVTEVQGQKPFKFHCEPVGGKSGTNVTERCEKWRNVYTGSAPADTPAAPAKAGKGKAGLGKHATGGIPSDATATTPAGPRGFKCDPTSKEIQDAMKAKGPDVAKAWDDQKADFEKNFKKRCMDKAADKTAGAGYQDLFCKECNVMKRMLYKMNKDAINYGCASTAAAAPAAAPAAPGAAPAAPGATPGTTTNK